jgi:acetyl esterase/lipase|tara:strand:- start:20940 stop:21815 length:876 start_codon:yes stop_codon:yes gene_type:complete
MILISFGLLFSLPSTAQEKKPPLPPEGATIQRDIIYATPDGTELGIDLYLPATKSEDLLPVVIWVHGGGWKNGSKNNCKAAFLAPNGFAVASINYRLTDVAQWPAQINDCYAAVRWLRQNAELYGLNPDRIGAFGSSAGGHLAALMGTRNAGAESVSSRVQAVCDWFGPADLLTMPPNVISENRTYEEVSRSNGALLLGETVMDVPDLAKNASALYQTSSDDPPFLIMHGSEDHAVPLAQSIQFYAALKEVGVDAKLYVVEGAGHGGSEFKSPEVESEVLAFFERTLKRRG